MLSASETKSLIERVGGDRNFGRLLGIDNKPWWMQRVNNWKRRGLPASVMVEHYDTIQRLRAEEQRKPS